MRQSTGKFGGKFWDNFGFNDRFEAILAALTCLILFVCSGLQFSLSMLPPPRVDVNLLFVPAKNAVMMTKTGYDNLIADAYWLGLLQYYGDRIVKDDKRTVNLDKMFDLITELDPRFYDAYFLGSWALADNGQGPAAVKLLQKAAKHDPTNAQYPFLEGFVEFLGNRNGQAAANAFMRSSQLPGANPRCIPLAARMLQTEGSDLLALDMWRKMEKNSTEKSLKEIAKRNVARIQKEIAGQSKRAFKLIKK
jgi:tetratricopeptide (TPR) repeat protein